MLHSAYVEILSTWEVWRALKMIELLSAAPRATLRLFRALQTSRVLNISTYARWAWTNC